MKLNRKELKEIEKCFFEIDQENKIAKVVLQCESIDDIFEQTYVSKMPILSVDFMSHIGAAFELIDSKYKLDLSIRFQDLGEYTEEQIAELVKQSFLLEIKSDISMNRKRNRIGYILIAIGIFCFFTMLAIQYIWLEDSIVKDIFFYIFDIITTVTFWEAMTILVVEQTEKRSVRKTLEKRLVDIHFEQK